MKSIKIYPVFLAIIFFLAGCVTGLKVKPRSPDKSVLYVSRGDAAITFNHAVKVFINGKEVTELSYDGYKALHVKPGTYEIEFRAGNKKGDLESVLKFTDKIEPNTVKFCSIAYNLGWRGPKKLLEGKDVLLFTRYKFEGEFDVTGTVSPK